jgi:hypothetical protein
MSADLLENATRTGRDLASAIGSTPLIRLARVAEAAPGVEV